MLRRSGWEQYDACISISGLDDSRGDEHRDSGRAVGDT